MVVMKPIAIVPIKPKASCVVERCMAPGGTNGSGLAAYVCVRDSPVAPVAVNRPVTKHIRPDQPGRAARRAHAVLAKVPNAVAARVPPAEQPAVLPVARLLAVAEGAPESDPVRHVATEPGCRQVGEWSFSAAHEGGDVNKVSGVTLYDCEGA